MVTRAVCRHLEDRLSPEGKRVALMMSGALGVKFSASEVADLMEMDRGEVGNYAIDACRRFHRELDVYRHSFGAWYNEWFQGEPAWWSAHSNRPRRASRPKKYADPWLRGRFVIIPDDSGDVESELLAEVDGLILLIN